MYEMRICMLEYFLLETRYADKVIVDVEVTDTTSEKLIEIKDITELSYSINTREYEYYLPNGNEKLVIFDIIKNPGAKQITKFAYTEAIYKGRRIGVFVHGYYENTEPISYKQMRQRFIPMIVQKTLTKRAGAEKKAVHYDSIFINRKDLKLEWVQKSKAYICKTKRVHSYSKTEIIRYFMPRLNGGYDKNFRPGDYEEVMEDYERDFINNIRKHIRELRVLEYTQRLDDDYIVIFTGNKSLDYNYGLSGLDMLKKEVKKVKYLDNTGLIRNIEILSLGDGLYEIIVERDRSKLSL